MLRRNLSLDEPVRLFAEQLVALAERDEPARVRRRSENPPPKARTNRDERAAILGHGGRLNGAADEEPRARVDRAAREIRGRRGLQARPALRAVVGEEHDAERPNGERVAVQGGREGAEVSGIGVEHGGREATALRRVEQRARGAR